MAPKVDVWNDELDFQLIEEVQAAPILWDVKVPRYSHNHTKDDVWEEIARKLGRNITGPVAKGRFTNMRTTFQQNNRKVENSKRSGTSPDNVYIPKSKLCYKLGFIKKTNTQANSTSNIESTSTEASGFSVNPNDFTVGIRATSNNPSLESGSSSVPVPDVYFDEQLQAWLIMPPDTVDVETSLDSPGSISPVTSPVPSMSQIQSQRLPGTPFASPSPPLRVPARPTSAPPVTSKNAAQSRDFLPPFPTDMYTKRGAKRKTADKSNEVMEAAVKAINDLAKQDSSATPQDSSEAFGDYVVARLREMNANDRKTARLAIWEALESQESNE